MIKLPGFYILLFCTAIVLTGCKQTKAPDPQSVAESITAEGIDYLSSENIELEPKTEIAMIATDSENSFYELVKKGAEHAISDLNQQLGYTGKQKISFSFASPKTESVIDQINIIDQFLDKAPDALCISFTDTSACKTQLQMAKNNGIHLIAFDALDESKAAEAMISIDNAAAATEAAAKMFDEVNYQGKIAVLVHNSLKQTGQERYKAITGELAEKYANKDLRVVDVVYLAQEERSDKEILDGLLEKHPDLAGIICTDLVTTEMVIDYTKKLKEKTFSIVGFDISEKITEAVNDGTIVGTIAQDPYHMGYATIIAAARSVAGLENAEDVLTSHLWVDKENVTDDKVQMLLNK